MKLGTLCYLSGLETPTDAQVCAREICAVTCNSRACVPGCIYVCISGTRADGHAFIEEALAKGAAAVVTERDHPIADGFVDKRGSAIFLSSDNTRRTAARLYRAWYACPDRDMTVVAVTGTNGKTTTSCMLYHILLQSGILTGWIGTLGCYIGNKRVPYSTQDALANMTTPDPEQLYHLLAIMRREGVRAVVMEASSHALALDKMEPMDVNLALFTNFSQDHLDFHGTMEAYLQAKAKLLKQAKAVILNADDPTILSLKSRVEGSLLTVSAKRTDTDMWAEQIALCGADGVRYTLLRTGEHLPISCRVPGEFTVYNSLLAAAAALSLGVSGQDVIKALDSFEGVKGRMERVRGTEHLPYTVLIDYAHTPDALEKLLRCAREICPKGGKIRLVFGCGGDRDRSKRAAMARVASAYADVIYLTKDNSRSEDPQRILQDMIAGIPEGVAYIVISDRAQAIRQAMVDAQKGDILLLAGKGHEEYEIDRDGRHPFDERNIVRDVIADNADTDNDDTNT